jgi:hypothetical protein
MMLFQTMNIVLLLGSQVLAHPPEPTLPPADPLDPIAQLFVSHALETESQHLQHSMMALSHRQQKWLVR